MSHDMVNVSYRLSDPGNNSFHDGSNLPFHTPNGNDLPNVEDFTYEEGNLMEGSFHGFEE